MCPRLHHLERPAGKNTDLACRDLGCQGVTEAGDLASYAPDFLDIWRNAARYIDRDLRGANPGDLPVEQPTKSLLLRADQVIE